MRSGLTGFLLISFFSLLPAVGQTAVQDGAVRQNGGTRQASDESQRLLPLPQGNSSDLRRQMELLRQFRALMEPREKQPTSGTQEPKSNAQAPESLAGQLREFEQLRDALQKLSGQLPRGIDPTQLDDMQKDQIQKALQDPAIQQQVKRLLQQFSKDGVIPPMDGTGTESPLPLPPQPLSPQETRDQEQKSSSESKPNPSANRKKPLTRRDSTGPDATQPQDRAPTPANPRDLSTSPAERQPVSDQPNTPAADASQTDTSQPDPASPETPKNDTKKETQTPGVPQSDVPAGEPSKSEYPESNVPSAKNRPTNDSTSDPAGPATTPNSSTPSIRPETAQQLRKFWNDLSDRITQDSSSEASPSRSDSSGSNSSGSDSSRSDSSRSGLSGPRPSNQKPASEILRDLEQNLPRNLPPIELPKSDPERSQSRQSMNGNSAPESLDVQKELQRGGIGGVFEKIIEQAQKEQKQEEQQLQRQHLENQRSSPTDSPMLNPSSGSVPDLKSGFGAAPPNASPSASSPPSSSPSSSGDSSLPNRNSAANGLRQGLENLKPGEDAEKRIRKALEDVGSEIRRMSEDGVQPPDMNRSAPNSWTPNLSDSTRIPGSSGMESPLRNADSGGALKGVGDTASQLMKSIVSPPTLPDLRSSAASGGGLSSPSLPTVPSGSAFMWVLAVIFGLVALAGVAFLMAKLGAPRLFDRLKPLSPFSEPLPQQLRNRRDIIRVFHAMALNPKNAAESWWTHRQVEQQLVQKSPQQTEAVKTLVEVYEQARYLPEEYPLPPAQIAAAEHAMHEVGVPGK